MVSLSVANDVACLPIAARLYLPEDWAGDFARRDTVHVPLDIRFQTKPAIALEQIRQAQVAGVAAGVVLGDEVYGGNPTFRQGVTALGLPYAVAVPATTRVCAPCDGRRARRWRRHGKPVLTVREAAGRLPRKAWRWVTWREGSAADLTGRFAMIRIGVAPDGDAVAREGEQTLLVEWPVGERDPIGYWLVTLPATTPLDTVVATAKGRWGIEQNYRDLKQEVGLGAFEGRSWRGFHHHVTLCIAA
jgi:SRSO17 transposase